jgi:hypothetical protein
VRLLLLLVVAVVIVVAVVVVIVVVGLRRCVYCVLCVGLGLPASVAIALGGCCRSCCVVLVAAVG